MPLACAGQLFQILCCIPHYVGDVQGVYMVSAFPIMSIAILFDYNVQVSSTLTL